MFAVIGLGPNDVKVPCLFFSSKEKAEEYLTSNVPNWSGDCERDMEDKTVSSKVFTKYYSGCGECWRFVVEEVQEGVPFVSWNLD